MTYLNLHIPTHFNEWLGVCEPDLFEVSKHQTYFFFIYENCVRNSLKFLYYVFYLFNFVLSKVFIVIM